MEIKLTTEEKEYRVNKYPDVSKVIKAEEVLKCTVCQKTVHNTPLGHPLLDVIVCKECHKFCDSDFSSDEDGTDKYCRWCGQGGTLYCCSRCKCAFCQKCVKRNCNEKVQDDIEQDDWKCFVCDVKPLWEARAFCWAVLKDFKENKTKSKKFQKIVSKRSSRNKAQSDSDSESESASEPRKRNTRQKPMKKLTNGKKYDTSDSSEDDVADNKTRLRRNLTQKNVKKKKSEDSDDSSCVEIKRKVSKQRTRKSSSERSDSETTRKKHKSLRRSKPKYKEESSSEEEETPNTRKKASASLNHKEKTRQAKHDTSSDDSDSGERKKVKPSCSSKHSKSEKDNSSYKAHKTKAPIENSKSSKIQDKDEHQSDNEVEITSDATSKGEESDNDTPDLKWLEGLVEEFTNFASKNAKKMSKIKELIEKKKSGEDVKNVCKVLYKEVKTSKKFLDEYKDNVIGDYTQWMKKDIKRSKKLALKKKKSTELSTRKKSAIVAEDKEKKESGTEELGCDKESHSKKTKKKDAKLQDSEEVEAENANEKKRGHQQSDTESDRIEKIVPNKMRKSTATNSEEESNNSDSKKIETNHKAKKTSSGSSEEEDLELDNQNKKSQTEKKHKELSSNETKKKNKSKKSDDELDNKKSSDGSAMEVDEEGDTAKKILSQPSEDDGKTYFSGAEDAETEKNDKDSDDENATQEFAGDADDTVNTSLAVLQEEALKLNEQLSNKVYDKLSKTIGRASIDLFSEDDLDSCGDQSSIFNNKTIELNESEGPNDSAKSTANKSILEAETESDISHINDGKEVDSQKTNMEDEEVDSQKTNMEDTNKIDMNTNDKDINEILLATTQEFLDTDENIANISTADNSPVKKVYRESVATAVCDSTDSERDLDTSEFNNQVNTNSDVEETEKIDNCIKSLEWSDDEKGEEEEQQIKKKSKNSIKSIDEDELCKNALLASSSSSSSSLSNNDDSDSDNWAPKKSTPSKSLKPGSKFKAATKDKEEESATKDKEEESTKRKIGPKSKIKGSKGETFRERNLRKSKAPKEFISNMDEFSDDIKLNCSCFVSLKEIEGEKVGGGKSRKRKAGHNSDDEIMNLADVDNVEKQRKKKSGKKKEDGEEKPSKPKRSNKKKKGEENGSQTGSPVASDVESDTEEQTVSKNGLSPIKSKTEDELAAEAILCSSNSEDTEPESDSEKKKKKKEKKTKKESSDKEEEEEEDKNDKKKKRDENALTDSEESDSEKKDKKKRPSWKNDKLLRAPLSDSNSEDDDDAFKKIQARQKKGEESSDSDEEVAIKKTRQKRKVKTRRQVLSDSDVELVESDNDDEAEKKEEKSSSDDDFWNNKKRKKRRGSSSSDEESSSSGGKKKSRKRRRIKKMSDSDSDDENLKSQKSDGTPGKRKNLRKILKEKDLEKTTQSAAQEEKERKQRIAERQKLYNEMYESRQLQEGIAVNELVLDFDPKTKETILEVHKDLVAKLKPHQAQGVKFMWDALFESVERAKKNKGSGCILAHCMGLGKTMQVVVLVHTLLTHPELELGVRTVLVVTPLSTVNNWCSEFSMWLHKVGDGDEVQCYNMSQVRVSERAIMLKNWQKRGGVAVMGYDLFRNLSNDKSKRTKKATIDAYHRCLVDPGADLVVCDEGHLLKNEKSKLSESMSQVKTRKRVVLTGTPLQNNLIEYHCMIQFVKPNLLGKRAEFTNRFVNPIKNGQCADSTDRDVLVMKRRAHVLHKMLEGCVQRFDYSVLTPLLKSKHEYVIKIRLTEVQILMYTFYLNNLARAAQVNKGASLFSDYQNLQRVWTHPLVMQLRADREEDKMLDDEEDSAGSLKDFIDDDDDDTSEDEASSNSNSNSSDSDIICEEDEDNPSKAKKRKKKETKVAAQDKKKYRTRGAIADGEEFEEEKENQEGMARNEWWSEFVKPDDLEVLANGNKLVLLFSILKECEAIGDKVLVFSQSLLSLDLIEHFLNKVDTATQENASADEFCGLTGSWSKGLDYFRLDGQTSTDLRTHWCKIFNNKNNLRARLFLISTRAGGLGINMVGANRVILFDASWNPSNDVQSIFRVYRFGQTKPCYIYRFLAAGTMEEKIYDRQVTKLALSGRVVDEHQIDRHFNAADLEELYSFNPIGQGDDRPTMLVPKDRLLAELLKEKSNVIESYHEHDSLLENKPEENLTEEERQMAWQDYETEKSHQENRLAMMEAAMQNQKAYMQAQMQAQQMMQQQSFASMQEVNTTMNSALQGLLGNFLTQNNPNMAGGSGANMSYEQQQRLYMMRQMQMQQQMAYQNATPGAAPMFNAAMMMPRTSKPVDIVELDDDEPQAAPSNTKGASGTGEKPKLKMRNDLF